MVLCGRYALLQRLGKERRQRLEESKKKFYLTREMNELESWVNDKVGEITPPCETTCGSLLHTYSWVLR